MPYTFETKNEARRLIVEEGRSPHEAAKLFGGKPTAQCLYNWSNKVDSYGKTWFDYRSELADQLYNATAPRAAMIKILEKMNAILDDAHFDSKKADALAKLTRVFREIVDERYHVQMFYAFASDFVLFVDANYPELKSEAFVACIRDFRTEVRSRLHVASA